MDQTHSRYKGASANVHVYLYALSMYTYYVCVFANGLCRYMCKPFFNVHVFANVCAFVKKYASVDTRCIICTYMYIHIVYICIYIYISYMLI